MAPNRLPTQTEAAALRLSDIAGLHPKVIELERIHGIPPYIHIRGQDLSADSILTLLQLSPIICRRRGDIVYCVGNSRIFQLARQFVEPEQIVPVHILLARKLEDIERLFIAERLLLPIALNNGRTKNKWLFSQWESHRIAINNLWAKPPLRDINDPIRFAKLLGVDARALK